ncbi:hypothetical protein [Streptomyces platensis]|uniref:hypothetical protein n=1 Tax=Streptomyces platensis TaxID=58346 RepID=UPI001F36C369|nr:hypothetical protein [Streptomyces platensis]MCF3142196.1 hypothetical protein [Streptomyces platensis]
MTTATAWGNLPDLIEANGGFLVWNVSELLALANAGAAGVRVVEGIERQLKEHNVGHLPQSIPRNRTRRDLLYTKDRPGLGLILHLARELAAVDGDTTPDRIDAHISALGLALGVYSRSAK